jgi:hypothetical protein
MQFRIFPALKRRAMIFCPCGTTGACKAGFALPRSSDDAVRLAISHILEWLAKRTDAKDGLKLPRGASLAGWELLVAG